MLRKPSHTGLFPRNQLGGIRNVFNQFNLYRIY